MGPEHDEDFEARSALSTLFDAEEIKMKGPEFLERVNQELARKEKILSSIRQALAFMDIDEDEEDGPDMDMMDFAKRLDRARAKERLMQNETPAERRFRVSKKREPIIGGIVVSKFT